MHACVLVLAQGRHIVLAGLKSFNGQLEFYSVDDAETMATAEHFMCTDLEWDPTGGWPWPPAVQSHNQLPPVLYP
jgi:hypothetical protein